MADLDTHGGPPVHVGIIMDGHGRWAQQTKLPRTMWHKEGLETAKKIVAAAAEAGVGYLTLYTFSTENWKRTAEETGFLMSLIRRHLRAEFAFYREKGIRVMHTGSSEGLPDDIRKELELVRTETEKFTGLTVVLAVNYGGRDEIVRAVRRIPCGDTDSISEEAFARFFDIPDLPDMDMLIRTGGEKRLSNFMLWHAAYAELFFCDTLWPDYSAGQFIKAIADFQARNRRFGGVK